MNKQTRQTSAPFRIYNHTFESGDNVIIDIERGKIETENQIFYVDYDDLDVALRCTMPIELLKIKLN